MSQSDPAGRPVIELIRALQSREIAGPQLAPEDRRACVEHLTLEGFSVAEAAAILSVSDRTVLRDRARIRAANAVERDPALAGQMVGRLFAEADAGMARLRRIARDRATPAAVRVDAERSAWGVLRDLAQLLQRMGYLPETARAIRADLTHRLEDGDMDAPGLEELAEELARLEAIQRACGEPGALAEIVEMRGAVARMTAADRMGRLASAMDAQATEGQNDDGDDD